MSVKTILGNLHDAGIKLGLDGSNLEIKAPQGALTAELREALVQNKAAIIEMLRLAGDIPSQTPSIAQRANPDEYPLSAAQERLWLISRLEADSAIYNVPHALRIKGNLDIFSLEAAINQVAQRHETLRAKFSTLDGQAIQSINQSFVFKLDIEKVTGNTPTDISRSADRALNEEALRPFDISQDPLIRGKLLQLADDEYLLLITMHHIVSDGWSVGLLFREIGDFYQTFRQHLAPSVEPLPIQYADFAQWQNRRLQEPLAEKQLAYWEKQLAGVATLELPLDRRREDVKGGHGASVTFKLDTALVAEIKRICNTEKITLSMLMSAAYSILLHRYSAQDDIVFGKPVANRNRTEIENLVGFFVNMLVERVNLSTNPTLKELYRQVKENAIASYENQDLPFERIVDAIKPERSQNKNPIFQVVLAVHSANSLDDAKQSQFAHALSLVDCDVNDYQMNIETARFDIELHIFEAPSRISGAWIYDTDLFDPASVQQMNESLLFILRQLVMQTDARVSEIRSLSDAQFRHLSKNLLQTQTDYPADKSVTELFEKQAEETPDAIAVSFDGRQLSYRSLNNRSNQLAHYLRARGVKAEVMVGVSIERSLDLVVALLGILKAGGAYVPLDPEYPLARLNFMLEDTAAPVLLTHSSVDRERLPTVSGTIIYLDQDWPAIEKESQDNPVSDITSDSLMYVIYTSGSTGKPKGVCVEHHSAVRLVKNTNYVDIKSQDVFLQFAPVAFDASTFELWGCLLNGARLVIYPHQRTSLEQLGNFIEQNSITTLWLTSALFNQMVDQHLQSFVAVKTLLAGGEALSTAKVNKYLAFLKQNSLTEHVLINGYGPTENTTFSCCHVMTAETEIGRSVPIGAAISNTQLYVLDSKGLPVPAGVPGELFLGGDGLARGYLNRPELTAERFVFAAFAGESATRLYRTGDQVRYRHDGIIEFIGRFDHQVKLRGFRIELGEVEEVICSHASVRVAVVMMREDEPGDKRLVAYLVLDKQKESSSAQIKEHVREQVPEYMLPSVFVVLDSLPLTPNGKVDRDALEPPGPERNVETDYVPPRTEDERRMAAIWCEFLGIETPGIDDNFFDLGGNSLLLMRTHARMCEVSGRDVPVTQLFRYPTIRGLAKQLVATEQGINAASIDKVRERAQKQRAAMHRQRSANATR